MICSSTLLGPVGVTQYPVPVARKDYAWLRAGNAQSASLIIMGECRAEEPKALAQEIPYFPHHEKFQGLTRHILDNKAPFMIKIIRNHACLKDHSM